MGGKISKEDYSIIIGDDNPYHEQTNPKRNESSEAVYAILRAYNKVR